ncbi:hypothetical protein CKM354_000335400 [Cercospora kikuchii]|uniref:Peptidase S8/S53 domain-containing protein n=1 Tax=Cercospora kikuchii TaxID=84275 RepID=A0A9P3CE16_9PEZI|nr:uncharacterized protein CKM354_000335400 [Cercospora kikuchii]GIZ39996.1 hypothetical protein CKM354_000335400 [Cercospora kikuchii]
MWRRFGQCIALATLGLSVSSVVAIPSQLSSQPSQPSSHQSGGEEHIVVIDKSKLVPAKVEEILRQLDLNTTHPDVRHVFNNSYFQGFSASMKSHCLDLLANMTEVAMVEKATTVSRGNVYSTRPNAPWGLQRISTASALKGSESSLDYTYNFADDSLGNGVDIYILDTGLYAQHNVFDGRANMLWSFDGDMRDNDGHGTHVSGTAAGSILGVASKAQLYGVKALDSNGLGSSSDVIAGIDYVIRRHEEQLRSGKDYTGSVISMSLATSEPVQAIDTAVSAALGAGIHVCVAAGNNGEDACQSSPASSGGSKGSAITVGAIDMDNQRASFSNHGSCVDLYAPGVNIISSWIGKPNMVNSLSGTSMATPHVTGIIAYAMKNKTLAASPSLMKKWLRMTALPLEDGTLSANNGIHASEKSRRAMNAPINRARIGQRNVWASSTTKVPIAGVVQLRK